MNNKLIGTLAVCNDCTDRFKCWTDRLKCAAPYSDNRLRKWRDDYPSLTGGVNIELANRQINRELMEKI